MTKRSVTSEPATTLWVSIRCKIKHLKHNANYGFRADFLSATQLAQQIDFQIETLIASHSM